MIVEQSNEARAAIGEFQRSDAFLISADDP